jgi:hypothetical protein
MTLQIDTLIHPNLSTMPTARMRPRKERKKERKKRKHKGKILPHHCMALQK